MPVLRKALSVGCNFTLIPLKIPKMTRKILMLILLLFINIENYGQNLLETNGSILVIESVFQKKTVEGDSVSVKINNTSSYDKGFTIEVESLIEETGSFYYNTVYSAYFNNDTLLLRNLRKAEKNIKKRKLKYVPSRCVLVPYDIKSNSVAAINFMIKGSSIPNGVLIRFVVTSDIVDDKTETTYSKPIKVFTSPM